MESVTYHSDTTWPQFQEYLPEENRLTPQAMPDEYYLHTYGGWENPCGPLSSAGVRCGGCGG